MLAPRAGRHPDRPQTRGCGSSPPTSGQLMGRRCRFVRLCRRTSAAEAPLRELLECATFHRTFVGEQSGAGPVGTLTCVGIRITSLHQRRYKLMHEVHNLELLKNAMATLDDRSESIIRERWLGNDKAKTLNNLAKKYNVSAERIRQIEKIALEKLKLVMSEER